MKRLSAEKFIRWRQLVWRFSLTVILGIPLYFKAVEYNFLWLFGNTPNMTSLESPKIPTASELYTADGELIGRYYKENRTPVPYDSLSPHLILALVATEDLRFYEHSGIDFKATLSILWYMIRNERRGGSTVSQQLAKNLFKTRQEDAKGLLANIPLLDVLIFKTKEWITAINLEKSYSKEEILDMYFNTVDFGSNAFGIKTASKIFFRTSPKKLTIQEAALLVGLLKAPTTYSPIKNPENALKRRNTVFFQMLKANFLTKTEYDSLCKLPIELRYTHESSEDGAATYFRGVMNNYLNTWCEANGYDLYADGLKVYTTIDSRMQAHAEKALKEHIKRLQRQFNDHWRGMDPWTDKLNRPLPNYLTTMIKQTDSYRMLVKKYPNKPDSVDYYLQLPRKMKVFSWEGEQDTLFSTIDSLRYYKHFLHASLMAAEPTTGQIKVWVGGINYKYFKFDHVKQARRQPGSTFKPFVYAAAIDSFNYSPCDRLVDQNVVIRYKENGEDKVWYPHNADWEVANKPMTLRHAFGRSINTVAAQLTEKIGWQAVAHYARKMGITSPLREVPSIGLGSSDVSLYDMVGAYGTFVNDGVWIEPNFISRIEDKNGKIIFRPNPKRSRAMTSETAFLMIHMFKGGLQEPGGTSGALYQYDIFGNNEIGGKTGTSSGHADGWYMGLTKDLVAGVWVGGDDLAIHFRTGDIGEGSKMALPIFGIFMENLYKDPEVDIQKGAFPKPSVKIIKPYWCPTAKIVRDTVGTDSLRQSLKDSVIIIE